MNWAGLAAGLVVGFGAERLAARRVLAEPGTFDHDDDIDWRHHYLDTPDGGQLHAIEVGNGPPIVLIHGVTLRAEIWRHQAELADEARVIAIDMRGHGESRAGRNGSSISANSADLDLLLNALDLERAVVAGHSMGGMVLGRCLADRPQLAGSRIGAVGFISTAARRPIGAPSPVVKPVVRRLQRAAARAPRAVRRLADLPDNDLGQLLVRATFGTSPDLADVRETAAAFEAIRIEELLDIVPSILDHDVIEFLSGWDLPSSVIVGSRDPLTPPRESRLLAERLSDATLEIVPGAGHQLMLERPDEVNSMLRHLVARAGVIRR